jgi:hypothetical protein
MNVLFVHTHSHAHRQKMTHVNDCVFLCMYVCIKYVCICTERQNMTHVNDCILLNDDSLEPFFISQEHLYIQV